MEQRNPARQDCEYAAWHVLTTAEQTAAQLLGYTKEGWNRELLEYVDATLPALRLRVRVAVCKCVRDRESARYTAVYTGYRP